MWGLSAILKTKQGMKTKHVTMNKIVILGIIMSAIACNRKNEETINSSLEKMYYQDSHDAYPLNDTMIFSKEIVELNRQCDAITNEDIERISKSLRQKPQQFIDQYLRIDEDKDYVLKSVPCTFLDSDNKCFIYDVRPKACREFPHTDRKKFNQITDLTLLNVVICPAAYNIVEKMKEKLPL